MATSVICDNDTIIDIGVDPWIGGNTNYFEKFFNLPNRLACLGVENDFTEFKQLYPNFELLLFDGKNFPCFDDKFDFAFSNAVIEHVGPNESQSVWLYNISKLTKKLFITTPNRWLPFETHTHTFFFHWFNNSIRNFFYRRIGKEYYTNNYIGYMEKRSSKNS